MSNETKISKADMKSAASAPAETAPIAAMTAAEFRALTGEKFAGLRILKLEVNEAAGPFTLVKILKDQDLSPAGAVKGKKAAHMAPVDVYVCSDREGVEIRMPVAAAFTGKAVDANLQPGDMFAVMRVEDYISRTYGTKAKGYAITVISRAPAPVFGTVKK